ncbi:hypothetical protein [Williamsia phyllosphaerae]|uniref:Anti-sigma-M factor RsmA n=1 Tax=Williamsia phyllosphaerae TaxID=885042 RepID=A0ABQ1UD94_9NOCA|nr:hypothetical protein [Williamsia phyllosphaerae]GGF16330.1 hypothetical protein GCM10007298_10450 [Williamsia phyllosphaerae]
MTDRQSADGPESVPPGPPFPVDLLADLHAGVLPDDDAAALWPRVRADPEAMRVMAALDATRSDLASAPLTAEPPPPAVAAAIESTLAAIRTDTAASEPPVPRVESIEDARDRQRDARRRRGMVIASIAAGIIAVVTLFIAVSTASMSSQGDTERADDATSSVPTAAPSAGAQAGALLSVLGRDDAAFTGQNGPDRLRRCLSANGVAPTTGVAGSGPLTIRGDPAVVILLSTGTAGRFEALVVGSSCDAGTPATISRRTLGAPGPTG